MKKRTKTFPRVVPLQEQALEELDTAAEYWIVSSNVTSRVAKKMRAIVKALKELNELPDKKGN